MSASAEQERDEYARNAAESESEPPHQTQMVHATDPEKNKRNESSNHKAQINHSVGCKDEVALLAVFGDRLVFRVF